MHVQTHVNKRSLSLSLALSRCTYVYTYMYITAVYIYIYTYVCCAYIRICTDMYSLLLPFLANTLSSFG